MKKTKIIFLLWILAFLLIYLRYGAASSILAVLFAVLYAGLAFLITRVSGRHLEIDITGSGMVEKDAVMPGTICIRNKARFPVFLAEGRVSARNLLTGEEQILPLAVSLWPRQSREECVQIREKYCGRIDMTVEDVRIYDPLKLFGRHLDVAGTGTGFVAPAISSMEIPAEYLDSYDMESYQYSQYEKGNDTGEVFGIRDYQEGDSPKQIHWKLSAKMDDLVVKIPSYPIENNILLILDNLLSPEAEVSPADRSKLMELFWSLSACLLEKGMTHSVGWYDGKTDIFRLQEIKDREAMWNTMPDALSCGFGRSEYSTVYRYLESLEDRGFSNHFLVTAQEERDIDRLENYGAVKVFRTTQ